MANDKEERQGCYQLCGVCTFMGLLLMVILLPMTWQKLNFYEAGIMMQKSTSKVDSDAVYGAGNHAIGPDYSFKVFQVSALSFDSTISVWSKATGGDAGTTLAVDVSFQYEIDYTKIGELYRRVGMDWEPLIQSYAIDAIRNTAPEFSADQFLIRRAEIENVFARNVSKAIAPLHCTIHSLQLRKIAFDDDYQDMKLTTAIQTELNEAEKYVQQSQIIRLMTDVESEVVLNQAKETSFQAQTKADLIVAKSNSAAQLLIEDSRNTALEAMYDELGVYSDAQKTALDYLLLLTVKGADTTQKLTTFVDFDAANSF